MDNSVLNESAKIERKDIKKDVINYTQYVTNTVDQIEHVTNVFSGCKTRKPRARKAYLTEISEAPAPYQPKASPGI